MNMIRVWGSGIYENDRFYQLCDEKGLLVWQDFMLSQTTHPISQDFLDNVQAEALDNVRRLRNHPCIALWYGDEGKSLKNPGGNQADTVLISAANHQIFGTILPAMVSEYSPNTPYLKPLSKDWKNGDFDYPDVSLDQKPFFNIGRFMWGYGFPSWPGLETVKSFSDSSDWHAGSETMNAHELPSGANAAIEKYMDDNYRKPLDFGDFLYVGKLMQAERMKAAMEAHRVEKPKKMGSLFWQLDDSWPGASFSSIDYLGKWKALQYYAQRVFSDVLVTPELKDGSIEVHIVSDRLKTFNAKLAVVAYNFSGKELYSRLENVKIPENSSGVFMNVKEGALDKNLHEESTYLKVALTEHNVVISENRLFFKPFKSLALEDPDLHLDVNEEKGQKYAIVVADKLAIGVCLLVPDGLNVFFENNYFDLDAGMVKKVKLKTDMDVQELKDKIKVVSLYDSYTGAADK